MHERASSWPTPYSTAVQAQTSPSYLYVHGQNFSGTKRFFLMITAPLCCQAFLGLRLCARSQRHEPQTALVPSYIDFTRSQTGLYLLSVSYYRLHSFPAALTSLVPRQASPTRMYARTYASHGCSAYINFRHLVFTRSPQCVCARSLVTEEVYIP